MGEMTVIHADIWWDLDDDPDGNVQHIAEHGLSIEEVESVLRDPRSVAAQDHRSGYPQVYGWTYTGRYIRVAYVEIQKDPRTIYPVTAFEVPEFRGHQRKKKQ
jgi:uncharacterized DUF497 family protein